MAETEGASSSIAYDPARGHFDMLLCTLTYLKLNTPSGPDGYIDLQKALSPENLSATFKTPIGKTAFVAEQIEQQDWAGWEAKIYEIGDAKGVILRHRSADTPTVNGKANCDETVVAVRGTRMLNLHEWRENLNGNQVPLPGVPGCNVDEGFYNECKDLYDPIMKELSRFNTGRLSFTGHSRAGASALYLALKMLNDPNVPQEVKGNFDGLYTFAAPRGGDPALARKADEMIPNYFRVNNAYDPVPDVPPPLWIGKQGKTLQYQHGGKLVELDEHGQRVEPGQQQNLIQDIKDFMKKIKDAGCHMPAEYLRITEAYAQGADSRKDLSLHPCDTPALQVARGTRFEGP